VSLKAAALLLLLSAPATAQSSITGDFWTSGTISVGTTTSQNASRFDVRAGSATEIPFSVFSQASASDPFPALQVERTGRVGTGVSASTWTRLDLWGVGDVGDVGLQLRFGNYWPGISTYTQITFGLNGESAYRHALRSVHFSSTARNGLDFWLWTPGAGSSAAMPDLRVVSLVTTSSVSVAGLEIMPPAGAGELNAQLVVSNGASAGGGTMHRWAEGTPSSRALKTDIAYMGEGAELVGLEDVQELKHARFRYK
jgi:hypothetical protein